MLLQKAGAWFGQQQRLVHQPGRCPVAVHAVAGQPHTAASISPANSVSLSASALSKRIKAATSTVELLQLHAANRDRLDSMHYAALFSKLVQAVEHSRTSTSSNYTSQQQHEQQLLPQQQQLYQQQRQSEVHMQQLLQALLAELPYVINSMQPGPLSAVLRALVKLQVQPQPQLLLALLYRAHKGLGFSAFGPRELCTIAHALVYLQPLNLPWTATAAAAAAAQAEVGPAVHEGHQPSSEQQQGDINSEQPSSTTTNSGSSPSSSWDPSLVRELFYALGRSLPRCNAQDAAQALLAVARLHYVPSEAWLQVWLQRATQLLPQFSPQGLANAAYGLVRTLQARGEVPSRSTQDWAQASRDAVGTDDNSSSSSVGRIAAQQGPQQQQQQPQQQSALLAAAHGWLQSCLKVAVLHAQSLKPQELIGQLLWAAGKLSCTPPEPARYHLLTAAESMLASCDARHLSAALYAFALLDHRPDAAAARALWPVLSAQVSNLGPRDLDEVLWAAGKLRLQPPAAVREQLQQQAVLLLGGRHAQPSQLAVLQEKQGFGQQSPRHVVGVLRGMAKLGWQLQEKYLVRLQGAVLEQLHWCVPQDFANMLWALAVAGVKVEARDTEAQSVAARDEEAVVSVPQHSAIPSRFLDRVLLAAENSLGNFSPQELSNTLWALAELQHSPSKVWMQELLLASLQQMGHYKPTDYSQTLCGLAKLGFSPSPLWLNTFWSKAGQSLTQSNFSAAELHSLLLAVVKFGVQPPQKWVQAAGFAVERGLDGFGSQQLLDVLRILQQLSQASTAARYHPAALSSSSSHWTSSMVPVRSSSNGGAACLRGLTLRMTPNPAVGSSSKSRCAPGVVRLYRQSIATNRVVVMSQGLLRPVWPPAMPASIPMPSSSSSASLSGLQQQQQQQQLALSHVDEAYGLACLVMLMPQDLRSKLDHWPQLLAASRAQQLQQQQQLGTSSMQQVAAMSR